MKISYERLEKEARDTEFRPEILEKVIHLLSLLQDFSDDKLLSSKIALKGGTALNLFIFDCPRLSIDIDINYIGSADRSIMLLDKDKITHQIEEICLNKNYRSQRKPSEHAGGKWIMRYQTELQGSPRLEIDLNFLTRVPLWEVKKIDSYKIGSYQARNVPVLDKHELAGGKLKALFSRHASRDLFDAHQLLTREKFDIQKLRVAFVVYGAMDRRDWREVRIDDVTLDINELRSMLIPMFKLNKEIEHKKIITWSNTLLSECQLVLTKLLPLNSNEIEFLNALLDRGKILPELISDDKCVCDKIALQPGLLWKAHNIKQYKGIE